MDVPVVVIEQYARGVEHAKTFADAPGRDRRDPEVYVGWPAVHVVPGQVPDLEQGRPGDGSSVERLGQRQHDRLPNLIRQHRAQAPKRRLVARRDPVDELA